MPGTPTLSIAGYADIIVGVSLYNAGIDQQGAALLWYGSATGLGPNGTLDNYDWMARGNKTYTRLGWAAETAGDVTGTGMPT